MKPLQILINAIIRYGVMIVLAYLAKNKIIQEDTLSNADIAEIVLYISAGAGVFFLAVYSRLKSRLGKLIAIELPAGHTEADVNEVIKQAPIGAVLAPTADKAADAVVIAQSTGKI